jgi:hypothetical protein
MLWDEDAFEDAGRRADATLHDSVSVDDFWAYMPMHSYIYAPTRDMWPSASVNARIPSIA